MAILKNWKYKSYAPLHIVGNCGDLKNIYWKFFRKRGIFNKIFFFFQITFTKWKTFATKKKSLAWRFPFLMFLDDQWKHKLVALTSMWNKETLKNVLDLGMCKCTNKSLIYIWAAISRRKVSLQHVYCFSPSVPKVT